MEPNFVLVSAPDPKALLWTTFPELRSEFDDGDFGPYYTYGRFAVHLSSNPNDELLWRRAYSFFDLLAADGGSLSDLLVVGIFESLADSPILEEKLRNNVGAVTLRLLDGMNAS
jgi:hypothetical protein